MEIPNKAAQLIKKQQIIIVGTSGRQICNVSPRTAFHIDQDGSIYWLELFRHKTLRNLKKNPWCTIAVFDKKKLTGFQLKGKARIISDKKVKRQSSAKIIDKLTRLHKQRILERPIKKKPSLIKFDTKLVYSLSPNELSDWPLAVEADDESLKHAEMQW